MLFLALIAGVVLWIYRRQIFGTRTTAPHATLAPSLGFSPEVMADLRRDAERKANEVLSQELYRQALARLTPISTTMETVTIQHPASAMANPPSGPPGPKP